MYFIVAYGHRNSNYIVTTDLKAGAYTYSILIKMKIIEQWEFYITYVHTAM